MVFLRGVPWNPLYALTEVRGTLCMPVLQIYTQVQIIIDDVKHPLFAMDLTLLKHRDAACGELGRALGKFTQLKRNKRFENFIMLVGVQGLLFHIAAWSHPVREAWGSQGFQRIPLVVITIQKKYSLTIYDVLFRSY